MDRLQNKLPAKFCLGKNFQWQNKKVKALGVWFSTGGGLKMIDAVSFNKSLKASWIKRYLDSENSSKWKTIFNLELGKYGGNTFFKGNLNKKDIDNLSIDDPFVKEIRENMVRHFL